MPRGANNTMGEHVACPWCRYAVRPLQGTCPRCALPVHAEPAPTAGATRRGKSTNAPVAEAAGVDFILGVDPGAKYLGLVARDRVGELGWVETFTGDFPDTTSWVLACVDRIAHITSQVPVIAIAVETITSPKGFRDGVRAPINPGHVARAAAVYGAVLGRWPDAIAVAPAGNGSKPADYYPVSLVGRRPKDLPGVSHRGVRTRNHEQSAFDIAGHAWQNPPLPQSVGAA